MQHPENKIIVAITGASGSIYAKTLLDTLIGIPTQLKEVSCVMSKNSEDVWQHELGNTSYKNYPYTFYSKNDFFAPFASGSSNYSAMIIVPCSMGTLGRIAHGISDDLITRAADVMLKEKRKLILITRETPLNLIQIKNMEILTLAGASICPATPSFYSKPNSFEELAKTVTDRALSLAGLNINMYRWGND